MKLNLVKSRLKYVKSHPDKRSSLMIPLLVFKMKIYQLKHHISIVNILILALRQT